jgi:hypothetical protein
MYQKIFWVKNFKDQLLQHILFETCVDNHLSLENIILLLILKKVIGVSFNNG